MPHPRWQEVYAKPITLPEFIDHIYSHRIFLNAIFTEGVKRLLEIGTGSGSMSIFLSHLGFQITSIDNNDEVIKIAQQNNEILRGNLKIIKADAFNLPFSENSFDLVFHQGFFEHFSNEEIHNLLTEQLRVAPIVVFSVPTCYYLSKSLGERLLTKREWENILTDFKVVESAYYGLPRPDSFLKRFLISIGWRRIYYYAKIKR